MNKFNKEINKISVGILNENEKIDFIRYVEEHLILDNENIIKVDNVYNDYTLTIIYTNRIDNLIGNVLDNGFYKIFWSKEVFEYNKIFLAFNSKKYILGICGDLNIMESSINKVLSSLINK